MRLTRRWLLGLFGAAAAAPVLPKVAAIEAATPIRAVATDQSIVDIPMLWGHYPGLYSDELSDILKEQVQPLTKFKGER
jgi:hypothetical protein